MGANRQEAATVETVRTLDLASASPAARGESCVCTAAGCKNATTNGKPFCLSHLASMPYVKRLELELAAQARAARSARRRERRPLAKVLEIARPALRAAS